MLICVGVIQPQCAVQSHCQPHTFTEAHHLTYLALSTCMCIKRFLQDIITCVIQQQLITSIYRHCRTLTTALQKHEQLDSTSITDTNNENKRHPKHKYVVCLQNHKRNTQNIVVAYNELNSLHAYVSHLKCQVGSADDVNFVTIATPNVLLSNDRHASNRMLWLTKTQTVVARQFPTVV